MFRHPTQFQANCCQTALPGISAHGVYWGGAATYVEFRHLLILTAAFGAILVSVAHARMLSDEPMEPDQHRLFDAKWHKTGYDPVLSSCLPLMIA